MQQRYPAPRGCGVDVVAGFVAVDPLLALLPFVVVSCQQAAGAADLLASGQTGYAARSPPASSSGTLMLDVFPWWKQWSLQARSKLFAEAPIPRDGRLRALLVVRESS